MKRWMHIAACAVFMLGVALSLPYASPAYADDGQGEINYGQGSCPGKGVIDRIVPCVTKAVQDSTERVTRQFSAYIWPIYLAFLTLMITIFGVRVASGEGEMQRKAFVFLFKVGATMLFVDTLGGFIPAVFGTLRDGADIVSSALSTTSMCNDGGGGAAGGGADTSGSIKLWEHLDCIMGKLFGYAPGYMLGNSIFGVLGAAVVSGSFGSQLMFGGAMVLIMTMFFILRCIFIYLMAHLVLALMIIISPLIIPLVFMNPTFVYSYYDKWLRAFMSTIMQPIIVIAYLCLALIIMDRVLFTDDDALFKTASKEKLESGWDGNRRRGVGGYTVNRPGWAVENVGAAANYWMKPQNLNRLSPRFSGGNDTGQTEMPQLNFGPQNEQELAKMTKSALKASIMAYLLYTMLNILLQMCQSMLGGGMALSQATKTQDGKDWTQSLLNPLSKAQGGSGQ